MFSLVIKNSAYVCIDIVSDGLELVNVIARKFVSLENAHRQPYLSSDKNIFSVQNLSAETFLILPSQVWKFPMEIQMLS